MNELKTAFKNTKVEENEKREELKKKINDEQKRLNHMLENIIEIDKFEFINELVEASNTCKDSELEHMIIDPELRGLISILNSTVDVDESVDKEHKKEEKKKAESEVFKRLIRRLNFESSIGKKQIAEIFIKCIQSDAKFKTKIFNNNFEIPNIIKNDGTVAMSGITGKSAAPVPLKDYLKNVCKYFDEVLKEYVAGKSKEELIEMVLDYELSDAKVKKLKIEKFKDRILANYSEGQIEAKISASKETLKEFKNNVKKICKVLKSVENFIKYMDKFEKSTLKDSYKKYNAVWSDIAKIIKSFKFKSESTIEDYIKEIVKVLSKIKGVDDKLHMIIFKDFINSLPSKLSNKTKAKLVKCIEEDIEPEFVEKAEKEHEFTSAEFKYLDSPDEELYDKSVYAKFGTIEGVKLSKPIRIALGLRIVSEIKMRILELKTNSITLIC